MITMLMTDITSESSSKSVISASFANVAEGSGSDASRHPIIEKPGGQPSTVDGSAGCHTTILPQ